MGLNRSEPMLAKITGPQWPPRCVTRSSAGPSQGCEFVGEPNGDQSPYLACAGDLQAHYRFPTRAAVAVVDGHLVAHLDGRVEPAPPADTVPAVLLPGEVVGPAPKPKPKRIRPTPETPALPHGRPIGGSRPVRAAPREIIGRIMCPVCRRPDTALMRDADGTEVVCTHGPIGHRCQQSENPLPTA